MSDKCPVCQSTNTERIDVAVEDISFTVWVVQCQDCGEVFEILVETDEVSK
jgi:hypothetical protein